ncbi:excinuclease ABC subunit A [Caldicellulosiruptor bescii]|uniref:UvrABC system protein A n=2 Tax=Caldicellulosiruptor bescii TaxID=31899 RepID=B9MS81_CALBD|nr:excinuclease ABC subunit UvrA [Caldicellulosiruptor bescii]ACM60535.1 excinuclease ABC, A subunit [Caldicellulosiruptor bescii DSM 6725]PBC87946.1 excinuclease ABC subunit A [Caldicellulosiruptor bescii]PBC90878.1 excinuclease ABC subunit A [Caldicellulosiruptor bescii]PBD03690.1 excinuclease ABC subunit A [Caldicellulosiruptor bescii]PBD06676.1 excinuclease ABC subunit A [Caldicellulosiruptor bescii]
MSKEYIVIKGAKEHNLKNIDLVLPRDKLIVFTGLSGSGKSSLAFDTIYAEGQRRYIESLSSYARQFLGMMEKPDVEYIEGLSPAISIDQKTTSKNPRSTVGTITEIYDYLRLLFARVGKPHCYICGKPISQQTVDQMVDEVLKLKEGTKIQILAAVVRGRKGEYQKLFEDLRRSGFARVRVDGIVYELEEEIKLDKNKKHSIDVIVDRLIVKEGIESRLAGSIETALQLAGGIVTVSIVDGDEIVFSQNFACVDCGVSYEEITPRLFSFNTPYGACPTCMGLGYLQKVDPDLLIPDKSIPIGQVEINGWNFTETNSYSRMILESLAKEYNFSLNTPVEKLDKKILDIFLYGTGEEKIKIYTPRGIYFAKYEGLINNLERRYKETQSEYVKQEIEEYMSTFTCPDCQGKRLKKEALAVLIEGKSIADVADMTVLQAKEFLKKLNLQGKDKVIAQPIIKEILARLDFLIDVGLDYLTLSRSAGTLSGGEAQRIRLATQIGSGLVGVLYILDEPSIGLHQRDNHRLIKTLKKLRDLGNTLIVVEHDEDTIRSADFIVDIGPGAGEHGGRVVAAGTLDDIISCEESITGQYLSGKKKIEIPDKRREPDGRWLTIKGASENNLKNIDVSFPVGLFTCVTGVSGSGKSTLVNEILYKAASAILNKSKEKPGKFQEIIGLEHFDKVINIDQSPIGRTPRSNPATYTGVFDYIREVFAQTPEAKLRGYKAGRFSFNLKGGRCEACSGDGIIKIEMHFLPDVYVPCDVCKGKRYNRETLEVKYKDKTIADVLEMTVEEALEFFKNIPRIKSKLQTLYDVGLGYIKLGQPSTTLSGGEAQRVKLATELSKKATGRTLYILDEPTTGLHMDDVNKLIAVLQRLVDMGNTVIVIEHNLDVIKVADYIIDLGPEGGDKGGEVVVCGSPEEVAMCERSYTGMFLKEILKDRIYAKK